MKKGTELEIKLSVPSSELLESIAADPFLSGWDERVVEHRSVYYDLPLSDDGNASLRFRTESGVGKVTLKLRGSRDGGLFRRTEYEAEAASAEEGFRLLSREPELSGLFQRGGAPVAGPRAEFCRRERRSELFGGVIELAFDKGWLGGEDNPFCEIEGELLSGEPSSLMLLEEYLKRKYCLEPQPLSKRARCEVYRALHKG